jgi:hypothetical protein
VVENAMEILTKAAENITQSLTPSNPQCVIIKILEKENRNVFNIIWGIPMDNRRHGINDFGHLLEPTPKIAILDAIANDEIIVINDTLADPRVNYMREHILHKGIQSLAVIPISLQQKIDWLIIIDKVAQEKKSFTAHQIKSLTKYKDHIEEKISNIDHLNVQPSLESILGDKAHILLNALSPIGGFSKRIKKTSNLEIIYNYADIIDREVAKVQKGFKIYVDLMRYAFGNNTKIKSVRIIDVLAWIEDDFEIESEFDTLNKTIMVDQNVIKTLLEAFKNYIAQNASSTDDPFICISEETFNIVIKISSDAFRRFKDDTDSDLRLLKEVILKQKGKMNIKESLCVIAFPSNN